MKLGGDIFFFQFTQDTTYLVGPPELCWGQKETIIFCGKIFCQCNVVLI